MGRYLLCDATIFNKAVAHESHSSVHQIILVPVSLVGIPHRVRVDLTSRFHTS